MSDLLVTSHSAKNLSTENYFEMIELDWLKQWMLYAPHRIALINGDEEISSEQNLFQQINYSDLYWLSVVGAHFLKQNYSIKNGDRVLHFSTNELASFVLFFSLQRLGATLVPINYRLTPREVLFIINDSEPQLVLFESSFLGVLESIEPQLKVKKNFWLPLTGTNSFFESVVNTYRKKDFKSLDQTFDAKQSSTALIIYTSGTTGFPKGAMISHRALFWNSINTTIRLNITENDSAVIFLPLFHTGGWNVLSTPFFHRGAQVILTKKFDPDQILKLSEKWKCTLLFGVPTTMSMMSRTALFQNIDLSSIRYAIVGGEPMPIEQIQLWQNKLIPIRQGYGLTEFGPNVFSLNENDSIRKMGSIGFPNFYVQVKVVNEQGVALGANQIGELWLKGPMAMTGYWKNPSATESTFFEGWLKTGDLVYFDDEGYFFVVGRKKDMYKSGGENVYPAEIENVLLQHPRIREAAVIGVHDEQWGEVGHAFVSLKDSSQNSKNDQFNDQLKNELKHLCLDQLAKFKNPKYYSIIADLPKGDSGKILKRNLVELIRQH